MKKTGKMVSSCIGIALLILVAVLAVKIVKGTFAFLGSTLNMILGLAVILGLVAIVIFMFSFAQKNKKRK